MDAVVTLAQALARDAHAGQYDKAGVDYAAGHLAAVAGALEPLGPAITAAGWLHDTLEDTALAATDLAAAGVPVGVVLTVQALTRPAGGTYQQWIEALVNSDGDPRELTVPLPGRASHQRLVRAALVVKLVDNAHNARQDRLGLLPADRARSLAKRYRRARAILMAGIGDASLCALVLERVNPELLAEL